MHNAIRIANHEDFSTLKRWLNVFARQSTTLPERPLSVLPGENGFNRLTFENSIRPKWRIFRLYPISHSDYMYCINVYQYFDLL